MMPSEFPGVLLGRGGHGSGNKKSKPAMEKRRRARINASLAELRSLIPESVKRGNRRCSKMEKADILELAVQYLRHLQDASKDKGQVSKTSYNLGFSECTQEVSEFFRSTSPTISTLKGSLLEHLNGCAPDSPPDSPSSSAAKSVPSSTNGFFKTSSIIARCLLSASTIVTPEKISGYARHASTPAAVSSTSDANGSEVTIDAQDDVYVNRLETGTEIPKPDVNETSHIHRLEIFKVKKDLINSFITEPQEHQHSPSRLDNHTTSNNTLGQSSMTVTVQENTELSNARIEKNLNNNKQEEDTSLSINITSGEATINGAADVGNHNTPAETDVSLVNATSLDRKEEDLQSENLVTVETSVSNVQALTQTDENTDVTMSNPLTKTKNNSTSGINVNEEAEIPQTNSLSAKAYSNIDSVSLRQLSENIPEYRCKSTISNVIENCIRDTIIHDHTLEPAHPLELSYAKSSRSDIEEITQNRTASKFQLKSISVEHIQNASDNTACSSENTSKTCLTMENPSVDVPNMSSFHLPAYVQTTLQGEMPSLQQVIILKSPNRTDPSAPTVDATSKSATPTLIEETAPPTLIEETATAHLSATSSKDVACSDVRFCAKKISETDCLLEFPLQSRNVSLQSSTARLFECQTQTGPQIDIKDSNSIPSLITTAGNKASTLPIIISPSLSKTIPDIQENNIINMKMISSQASDPKLNNASSVFLFNKLKLANFSLFNRKRPLSDADPLAEKNDDPERSHSENSSTTKRTRFSPTSLFQSTSYQDSGYTNATLNQYMATKFRAIAPKNVSPGNIDSRVGNVFQQQSKFNQLPVKQLIPCENNVFASTCLPNNAVCVNSNVQIDKEHIPNHNSYVYSRSMEQPQTLTQDEHVKGFTGKESVNASLKADDILTTVLKSSFPMNKTLFEARRLNTSNLHKNGSFPECEASNKSQNPHLLHENEHSSCQSYIESKSRTQGSAFKDQESTVLFENQMCEVEKVEETAVDDENLQRTCINNDTNIVLDLPSKHAHVNVSATLREFDHRCRLTEGACKPSNSAGSKFVPAQYQHACVTGITETPSPVCPRHDEDGKTSPIDMIVNQNKHSCMFLGNKVVEKGHVSFMKPSTKKVIAVLTTNVTAEKGRISSNKEQYVMNRDSDIDVTHSSSKDNVPSILDWTCTQPLNLSLRDHNRETNAPTFNDAESADTEYSPGLDLSVRRCIKTTASTSKAFQNSPPSQSFPGSDHENNPLTIKPYTEAGFHVGNNSRANGANQTCVIDSDNLSTLFSSVSFASAGRSDCITSPNIDSHLSHKTNTECRAYTTADTSRVSRPISLATRSGETTPKYRFENYHEDMLCTWRTPVHVVGSSLSVAHKCGSSSEKATISPTMTSLLPVYHNPVGFPVVVDDVWRPW